ncbi:putative sec1-like protein [Rosa chinensis]|uniref:Putative sec1-like protein n=1 Tax=Rosa chinensis TaxID=74649 RepID=A0A2P6PXA2_ROSCH|nr:putative sec1-like protein [Rosa chinensis]
MPFSSSGGSSSYKNFRQITRDRLLHEMLGSCKRGDSTQWKVLIMDELTTTIMSYTCTVSDTTEEGVSLLERIEKKRQPMPHMDAIYFIRPSKKKAFIFFSSPISKDLVGRIKEDGSVLSRISALSEMNLEYFAIDSQVFVTNNERALEQLYGDKEDSCKGIACLNEIAARIATVFASLKEFPIVRYRAAKLLDATTITTFPDLIPTKLAAGIWDCLIKYKNTIPNFPVTESCELLILDRSVDQIAPVIHEWTYDAMCHDLLNMEGNRYLLEVPSKTGGLADKKGVLLEEHDPVWLEFRHEHIAEVSERLNEKLTNFLSNNKAAQLQNSSDWGSHERSTRELKKITQALPQYGKQKDRLSLHSEIAKKIHSISRELGLRELAQLEQALVFGYAGMKDVIKFLRTKDDTTGENKLRLLMILAAIYPEKFEGEEGQENLMKLCNNQKNCASRKERPSEEKWQFSSFYPIIEELIEKLSKGELSKEDYPCLNDPTPTLHQSPQAHSIRSRRTPTWAQRGISGDGISRHASNDFKKMGKRIFVVIVGGATRSELRVCHKLTAKLKREVVLGSTSLDDPATFITVKSSYFSILNKQISPLTSSYIENVNIDVILCRK